MNRNQVAAIIIGVAAVAVAVAAFPKQVSRHPGPPPPPPISWSPVPGVAIVSAEQQGEILAFQIDWEALGTVVGTITSLTITAVWALRTRA